MRIEIEINGRKATVSSGDYKEEMKVVWLMKQFKLNDLYLYLKEKSINSNLQKRHKGNFK